jgi:hypothetical protein
MDWRKEGFVISNSKGKPLSQTNLVRRDFRSLLKRLGIEKQGFHGFRRFRCTWLRRNQVSEDLLKYWLGHAPPGCDRPLFQGLRGRKLQTHGQRKSGPRLSAKISGAPGATRTPDLVLRRHTLYPTELQARGWFRARSAKSVQAEQF